MRFGVLPKKMTMREADALQLFLQRLDGVQKATVHERTGCATVLYTGERAALIEAVRHFHYEDVDEDLSLQIHSREMNAYYTDKLIFKVAYRGIRKLFFPAWLRHIRTVIRSIPYLWRGVRCILRGR